MARQSFSSSESSDDSIDRLPTPITQSRKASGASSASRASKRPVRQSSRQDSSSDSETTESSSEESDAAIHFMDKNADLEKGLGGKNWVMNSVAKGSTGRSKSTSKASNSKSNSRKTFFDIGKNSGPTYAAVPGGESDSNSDAPAPPSRSQVTTSTKNGPAKDSYPDSYSDDSDPVPTQSEVSKSSVGDKKKKSSKKRGVTAGGAGGDGDQGSSKKVWIWVGIGVLVILIIAAIVLFFLSRKSTSGAPAGESTLEPGHQLDGTGSSSSNAVPTIATDGADAPTSEPGSTSSPVDTNATEGETEGASEGTRTTTPAEGQTTSAGTGGDGQHTGESQPTTTRAEGQATTTSENNGIPTPTGASNGTDPSSNNSGYGQGGENGWSTNTPSTNSTENPAGIPSTNTTTSDPFAQPTEGSGGPGGQGQNPTNMETFPSFGNDPTQGGGSNDGQYHPSTGNNHQGEYTEGSWTNQYGNTPTSANWGSPISTVTTQPSRPEWTITSPTPGTASPDTTAPASQDPWANWSTWKEANNGGNMGGGQYITPSRLLSDDHGHTDAKPAATGVGSVITASENQLIGKASWFQASQHLSQCHTVFSDSDLVVALDESLFGAAGVVSPFCGRHMVITNPNNGKSVLVTVQDVCTLCNGMLDLDLSRSAFAAIADLDSGVLEAVWSWVEPEVASKMGQVVGGAVTGAVTMQAEAGEVYTGTADPTPVDGQWQNDQPSATPAVQDGYAAEGDAYNGW